MKIRRKMSVVESVEVFRTTVLKNTSGGLLLMLSQQQTSKP